MIWQSLLILVVVVGALMIFGVITNLLSATTGPWKRLAERFPPVPPSGPTDDSRGWVRIVRADKWEASRRPSRMGCLGCLGILFFPWLWFRMGMMYTAITAVDSEHLHMRLDTSVLAPKAAMSLPLAMMEQVWAGESRWGAFVAMRIEDWVVELPAAVVERELAARALIADADAAAQERGEAFSMPALAPGQDPDEAVIAQLRGRGIDPDSTHEIDFHFSFPTEDAARSAAMDLGETFESTRVLPPVDIEHPAWGVHGGRMMAPEPGTMRDMRARLDGLAAQHGGTYDGWGIAGV